MIMKFSCFLFIAQRIVTRFFNMVQKFCHTHHDIMSLPTPVQAFPAISSCPSCTLATHTTDCILSTSSRFVHSFSSDRITFPLSHWRTHLLIPSSNATFFLQLFGLIGTKEFLAKFPFCCSNYHIILQLFVDVVIFSFEFLRSVIVNRSSLCPLRQRRDS